jgi:hypothetical protein
MADLRLKSSDEIFSAIQATALELYPNESWSGLREGTFEWLLAKVVAEVSSINGQYLDLRALNAYISTAITRRDLRNVASNLGLFPRERAGATVDLSITASADVTIPKGSEFISTSGESFCSTAALVLSTGSSLSGTVQVVHSKYQQKTVIASGNDGEVIELLKDDVLPEHVTVTVDSVEWTAVDHWGDSSSTDTHFIVSFDDRNRAGLVFGNGTYGARLSAGASIVIDIYTGGGLAGNAVDAGEIDTLVSSFSGSSNVSTITNISAPSGGRAADSFETVRNQIPAQMASVSGIINSVDGADALVAALSWCQDAYIDTGFNLHAGTYVPTATVVALPASDSVASMSSAQQAELAELLADRGVIGVQWNTVNAIEAPIEISAELTLSNRNLANEKLASVKSVISTGDDAIFSPLNFSFEKEYTEQEILSSILEIPGISYAKLTRFARIPQVLVVSGEETEGDVFADIELGENAEDGYFLFDVTAANAADSYFNRPIYPIRLGSDFIVCDNQNWLVESHSFATGSLLNDTNGPYIKTNGSSKIEFNQLTRVWKDDLFNGTFFSDKYLMKISWVDDSDIPREAFYTIADTAKPGTITSTEDADSPIAGTAITTLANADYSTITVDIIESQITGSLVSPLGDSLSILYNSSNTVYTTTATVLQTIPLGQYSHIRFSEAALSTVATSWMANSEILRARLDTTKTFASTNSMLHIYTTPLVAPMLSYKNPREVWTCSGEAIGLTVL